MTTLSPWNVFDDGCMYGFGYARPLTVGNLYLTGALAADSKTTRRYETTGSPPAPAWSYLANNNSTLWVDTFPGVDGAVISVTNTNAGQVERFDSSGNQLWTSEAGPVQKAVQQVAMGPGGVAYSIHNDGVAAIIRKWDPDGLHEWDVTITRSGIGDFRISIPKTDSAGNVYSALSQGTPATGNPMRLRSYDPDGNFRWESDTSLVINGTCQAIQSGAVLVLADASPGTAAFLTAISTADGSTLWTHNQPSSLVRFISARFLAGGDIAMTEIDDGDFYLRRYSESGGALTQVWSTALPAHILNFSDVQRMTIGPDDSIYVGGLRRSSLTHYKYSAGGVLQWSADHGANVTGLAF